MITNLAEFIMETGITATVAAVETPARAEWMATAMRVPCQAYEVTLALDGRTMPVVVVMPVGKTVDIGAALRTVQAPIQGYVWTGESFANWCLEFDRLEGDRADWLDAQKTTQEARAFFGEHFDTFLDVGW